MSVLGGKGSVTIMNEVRQVVYVYNKQSLCLLPYTHHSTCEM